MPITKSAKKALRQSKRKHAYNVTRKKRFRAATKEFKQAITNKDFDTAKQLLPKVYKYLDKAAKGKTIKKNTASRMKSRLSRKLPNSNPTATA